MSDPSVIPPPAPSTNDGVTVEPPPPIEGARKTAKSVLFSNALAGIVIRGGGLMVVVAVIGILVFLVAMVVPLFRPATVVERPGAGRAPVTGTVRLLAMDEYRLVAVAVGDAPEVVAFRTDDGSVIGRFPIAGIANEHVTAARRSVRTAASVVGTREGHLDFLSISFRSDFLMGDSAESVRASMKLGDVRTVDGAVVQRKPGGNLLRVKVEVGFRGSVRLPAEAGAVGSAAYEFTDEAGVCAVVAADGLPRVIRETAPEGDAGGHRKFALAEPDAAGPESPKALVHCLVDEDARIAWFADRDGAVLRVDVTGTVPVRREVKLTAQAGRAPSELTAFEFVLGDHSLLLGTGSGEVSVWSLASKEGETGSTDAKVLRRFHLLPGLGSAVARIASAPTRRSFYVGLADGRLVAAYPTNERIVCETNAFPGPIIALAPGWKDDGVLVVGPGLGYKAYDLDNPHPETNVRAVFGEVHYEGYDRPTYTYQSSSSTDEAEPKLSLTPLVFGTLKAVFYAMLFALPLALLAALYTSQFMHSKVRAYVKPGIEVMASLPSVVLGFLAALVIAPAIASVVPAVFGALFAIVAVAFVAGVAWQGIPIEARQSVSSGARLLIAMALVVVVIFVSIKSVGSVQRAIFSGPSNLDGDFRIWLTAAAGTGDGLPLLRLTMGVLGAMLGFAFVPRWLPLSHLAGAGRALARIGGWVVGPALLFVLLAPVVDHVAFSDSFRWFLVGKGDGRGTEFVQLNSLVVGIAMGFAVIPVVYTIAEDALSSIPDSLRSAALGCGASPWQVATRVIVPAAIPGLFSATMIGLGRAVGETMIVLMATGGTAIIDGSIFNGFRTLSANIATEMPEAPVGSTLYRVLFLAGLLLFALTFVLNTIAEMVRLRFRKKFRGL